MTLGCLPEACTLATPTVLSLRSACSFFFTCLLTKVMLKVVINAEQSSACPDCLYTDCILLLLSGTFWEFGSQDLRVAERKLRLITSMYRSTCALFTLYSYLAHIRGSYLAFFEQWGPGGLCGSSQCNGRNGVAVSWLARKSCWLILKQKGWGAWRCV